MDYSKFVTASTGFWDNAHKRADAGLVADHKVDKFKEMYYRAGLWSWFVEDLHHAMRVLDIGPGYAEVLRDDLCASKDKFAVEISPVNRARLADWGITAVAPGEGLPSLAGVIDMAWSTSCFNHCHPEMLDILVQQLSSLLKFGGVAYLENVYSLTGSNAPPDPVAGPFGVESARFIDLCWSHNLRLLHFSDLPIYDSPHGMVPWGRYIARVRKEG